MIGWKLSRLACVFGLLIGGAAEAASFDCRRAASVDERAVCANPTLSTLDSLLPAAFAQAKAQMTDEVTRLDRDFLGDRRACGSNVPCLMAAYVGVLQRFHLYGAAQTVPPGITARSISGDRPPQATGLPARLGACTTTSISGVGPRLASGGGAPTAKDFDAGTVVTFANHGLQVSYEREPKLIASEPRDPVSMCLVSIPHHCPRGDDRGRFYMVTNMRTGQTWTLPDSQHLCGGA